jgi:hypothetical protein
MWKFVVRSWLVEEVGIRWPAVIDGDHLPVKDLPKGRSANGPTTKEIVSIGSTNDASIFGRELKRLSISVFRKINTPALTLDASRRLQQDRRM